MAHKWFVQKDDVIHGPYTTDDVHNRLQAGQISPSHLIWGNGQEQWVPLKSWNGVSEAADTGGSSTGSTDSTANASWHYAAGGQSYGPLTRKNLIQALKNLPFLGEVMIWTKGMKEWAPLFEFHDILSEVGINKRQFPRADLEGKAVLKAGGVTLIGNLLSISEGGLGVELMATNLVPGEALTLEMQSPAFRDPITAKVEVRYVGETVLGLKFTQISSEVKGAIIQFIKQSQARFPIKAA